MFVGGSDSVSEVIYFYFDPAMHFLRSCRANYENISLSDRIRLELTR